MRKIMLLSLLIVIAVSVQSCKKSPDVRELNWGDSYLKVVEIEGPLQLQAKNSHPEIEYYYKPEEILPGYDGEILFGFLNEGLVSVTYSTDKYDFRIATKLTNRLRSILQSKYGDGADKVEGLELIYNTLHVFTTPKTEIRLRHMGTQSFQNFVEIEYDAIDKQEIKENSNKF